VRPAKKLHSTLLRILLTACLSACGACGSDSKKPNQDASSQADAALNDAGGEQTGKDAASGDGDGDMDATASGDRDASQLIDGSPRADGSTGQDGSNGSDADAGNGAGTSSDAGSDAATGTDAGTDAGTDSGSTPQCTPSNTVEQTYAVTSPGFYFAIDGVANNPGITLKRGKKYKFKVTTSNIHPFSIRTGSTSASMLYNDGVTNNDSYDKIITFDVPCGAPDPLYYVCTVHSFFGTITIVDP
jgi:hypothetical protein